jgi:hypothetical protein
VDVCWIDRSGVYETRRFGLRAVTSSAVARGARRRGTPTPATAP